MNVIGIKIDIDLLIDELLGTIEVDGDEIVFTEEAEKLVHLISDTIIEIHPIKMDKKTEDYMNGKTASDIYKDMMIEMILSPIPELMRMSVLRHLPMVSEKLREGDVSN